MLNLKKYWLLGILLLISLGFIVSVTVALYMVYTITDTTSEEQACAQKGGTWDSDHSPLPVMDPRYYHCVLHYKDANKACTSNADCQGFCYVPLNSAKHDHNGYVLGKCVSSSDPIQGCVAAASLPQPLKELPADSGMCVD